MGSIAKALSSAVGRPLELSLSDQRRGEVAQVVWRRRFDRERLPRGGFRLGKPSLLLVDGAEIAEGQGVPGIVDDRFSVARQGLVELTLEVQSQAEAVMRLGVIRL